MTDFARLVLASDTTGLRDARAELRHLTSQGDTTERRLNTATSKMGAAFRNVALQVGAMVSAAAGFSAMARGSQEVVGITNGLRAMGLTAAEAADALDRIVGISQRTRAPLRETAELYRRVTVAGRDLGATQQDIERFTENVGLALGASGTSAQEASGALLQLSQAMAGGIVRAEEFNSILEGAFPIAQAAADGIDAAGGSVGRLRILVTEGKISSEEFFRAIISQTDELEAAFARTTPTIAQALSVLSTSIATASADMDAALGVSAFLAQGIISAAGAIDSMADAFGSARAAADDMLTILIPFVGEIDSLQVLVSGTAAVVAGMYIPTIVAATGTTMAWVASLITLRGALLATGIGALIVGAGTLIDFLLRLRSATGSWGEALSALGDLAAGVWEGIKTSASALVPALGAIWADIAAGFYTMLEGISGAFSEFMGMFTSLSSLPSIGLTAPFKALGDAAVSVTNAVDGFSASANRATLEGQQLRFMADTLAQSGFDKARDAAAALSEILNKNIDETTEAADAARELAEELDKVAGADGSGGARAAAAGVDEVTAANDRLADASRQVEGAFGQAFTGIITGSQSAGEALGRLLQQLAAMWAEAAFQNLLGGAFGGGGFLSFLIPSFDGGGHTGNGPRSGGLDGKGGFLSMMHPNETVIDHSKGQSAGGGQMVIKLDLSPDLEARIMEQSGAQSVQLIQGFNNQVLPQRLQQISRDPRKRGR